MINDSIHNINIVAGFSQGELETWLKIFLQYGYAGELIHLDIMNDYYSRIVLDQIWNNIETSKLNLLEREGLRKRIRSAVHKLCAKWYPDTETKEYLSELTSVIGQLNITDCFEKLYGLALNPTLVKNGDGLDIHLEILKTLMGMDLDDDREAKRVRERKLEILLKKDIHHPKYAAKCFRKLWETNPDNGIQYMKDFLSSSRHLGNLVRSATLTRFHEALGPTFFKEHFLQIRGTLLLSEETLDIGNPVLLYELYIEGIKDLCTLSCIPTVESELYPELTSRLSKSAIQLPLAEKPGILVKWHPPYKPSERREFHIQFDPEEVDYNVLEEEVNSTIDYDETLRSEVAHARWN